MPRPRVFFDLTIGGEIPVVNGVPTSRVVFELFDDIVPITAENFRALCTGEKSTPDKLLHYKDSVFHRIITDRGGGFMILAGDITRHNGTGGHSIYDQGNFADEDKTWKLKFRDPYMLAMNNAGADTNGSQFIITVLPCPWLNGKHQIFGKIVEGIDLIEHVMLFGNIESAAPIKEVVIADCGELK